MRALPLRHLLTPRDDRLLTARQLRPRVGHSARCVLGARRHGGELATDLAVGPREPTRLQGTYFELGRDAGSLVLEALAILARRDFRDPQRLQRVIGCGHAVADA